MYIDIDYMCCNITYLYCENVIVGVIEYWNARFHASKPKYILGFYLKKLVSVWFSLLSRLHTVLSHKERSCTF